MSTTNQYRERFKDADWANTLQTIVIGGVGNIGSWVSLFLSRIGHDLVLYDNDTVEDVNMAGQFYTTDNIGNYKADSVRYQCIQFCGSNNDIDSITDLYTNESMTTPIMISGFDNMAAREVMFNNWCSQEDRELFIDGRVTAEVGMVYFVQKGQEEEYRRVLFPDEAVIDAACSYKSTSHCGAYIASLMTNGLNSYLGNKVTGIDARSLPFEVQFQLPIFNMEVKYAVQSSEVRETGVVVEE